MSLHSTQLKPSRTREPYFDGWDTAKAIYWCECSICQAKIAIPFSTVHLGAWGWREKFSPIEVKSIEMLFPEVKKAEQGSRRTCSSVSEATCITCNTSYIFYAEVDEYKNSVFRLVAQGLARRGA